MKGVYYNLVFSRPTHHDVDEAEIMYEKLSMNECLDKVNDYFKNFYNIDTEVSRHTIYNLCKRPLSTSRFIRTNVKVNKYLS